MEIHCKYYLSFFGSRLSCRFIIKYSPHYQWVEGQIVENGERSVDMSTVEIDRQNLKRNESTSNEEIQEANPLPVPVHIREQEPSDSLNPREYVWSRTDYAMTYAMTYATVYSVNISMTCTDSS